MGLGEDSLKNQRKQTPSAETQREMGDSASSNHGGYFMYLIKVTQMTSLKSFTLCFCHKIAPNFPK